MKVFISYSHHQAEWVRGRLCTSLSAGGAEVLIDVRQFQAGTPVYTQMDAQQDAADMQILVLSPEYLESRACRHEMDRAIAADPAFASGRVIPVVRKACTMPAAITSANPLWADLTDESKADQWQLVLDRSGVDLGAAAPAWLAALTQVRLFLDRRDSVNLRVTGSPRWRELLDQVGVPQIDLSSGAAAGRRYLIAEMLGACGHTADVRTPPEDLVDLQNRLGRASGARLAFRHFDLVARRDYGDDYFWALNHLVDTRKLVLLIQSRESLPSLVPRSLLQSGWVAKTKVVELHGQ